MTAPALIYVNPFTMEDGTAPDLTLDKNYVIICSYKDPESGYICLDIIDDEDTVHSMTVDDPEHFASKYFDIVGDYMDVWEEA